MDRDAADAAALLHHEDGAAELRGLDGGATAGGAAADDNEIEGAHGWRDCGRKWRRVYRNRGVGDSLRRCGDMRGDVRRIVADAEEDPGLAAVEEVHAEEVEPWKTG